MKNNKILKRAGSVLMSAALAASMALPGFAMTPADHITITMKGGSGSSMFSGVSGTGTFGAYRIMNLTTSLKEGDTCEGEHTKNCYNYNYTINSTYQAALNAAAAAADKDSVSGVSTAELLDYLGNMDSNGDAIRKFANALYDQIKNQAVDAAADEDGKFNNLPQGYYLIAETGLGASPDSRSLVMLDTRGELEMDVTAKEDVPELEKTVADTDSSTFEESVMASIGEEVTFKLEGTLPKNIYGYSFYKYVFHDKLPAGLDYVDGSMKVMMGNVDITDLFTENKACADGCSISFGCDNLLSDEALALIMGDDGFVGDKITLTYKAEVNDNIQLGNPGNINGAELEFSNDPYDENSSDKTPEDEATVFSAELVINKTDADDNPLKGATFTLYKWDGSNYAAVAPATMDEAGTIHTFTGLGDGKYKLEESGVPDGYSKAEDIIFVIGDDTYKDNPGAPKSAQSLNGFTVKDENGNVISTMIVNAGAGNISTTIKNVSGSHLPTTGAAGTYAIYGAAVVLLAAGVTLVVLKKKKK